MRKPLITALLALIASGVAMASSEDELTSLSYIAYLERYATVQPADQEQGLEAVINMPLVSGDRVDTAREARMEVQLSDGSTIWIDQYSAVSFDAIAYSRDASSDRTVLFIAEGTIMVEIPQTALPSEPMRVDAQSATVHLNREGLYLIEALRPGGLRVESWQGLAEASTSGGGVLVRAESSAELRDGKVLNSEVQLSFYSDFAEWVELRRQFPQGESSRHLDLRYGRQAAQLDNYGEWVYLDNNDTWAWKPQVSTTWQPYTAGRWYWTNTGWAWISYEPWGWLPYHYGSWAYEPVYGWVWSWGSYWAPAWVSWVSWPGYIGWCPVGYHSYWYWGHWGHHHHYDHYHGYYPGGPGGGSGYRPPRRDVIPPRGSAVADGAVGVSGGTPRVQAQPRGDVTVRSGTPRAVPASELALDLRGKTRLDSIDGRGWAVARVEDFNSPHLSRLVERGEDAFPRNGDRDGTVMTGPLVTRSPGTSETRREIGRVFERAGGGEQADLTPILSGRTDIPAEQAIRLAAPTTQAELAKRSTTQRQPTTTQTNVSATPSLSRGAFTTPSETARREGIGRPTGSQQRRPNLYRPSSRTEVSSGSPTVIRPGASRTSPSGSSDLRQPTRSIEGRGTVSVPRQNTIRSRQPVTPSRSGIGVQTRSPTSSGPVLVPRTSSSRPSRQLSGRAPSTRSSRAPSPTYRSSPSSSRSPGKSSVSSGSGRSRSPSPKSAGSSRSSSGSSRSSGSSSSKARRR